MQSDNITSINFADLCKEEWFVSKVLKKCAIIVVRKVSNLNMDLEHLGLYEQADIENELCLFIAALVNKVNIDLINLLEENNLSKFINMIANRFINDLIDKRRKWDTSIWHSRYRHIRHVLSKADNIRYMTENNRSFYSVDDVAGMGKWSSSHINYKEWDPPDIPIQNPDAKDDIVVLAEYFYNLVKLKNGSPCWVAIRELTNYITTWYGKPYDVNAPLESETGDYSHTEYGLTSESLLKISQMAADKLTDKEKEVLCLRHLKNYSLKETAKILGMKSASAVKYHQDNAYAKIKGVCIEWPGLSPEDLNQDLFELFWRNLIERCKAATGCR